MKCRVCGKTLTGKSTVDGLGPVCAKHRAAALQPHLSDVRPPISMESFDETDNDPDRVVIDFDALRRRPLTN